MAHTTASAPLDRLIGLVEEQHVQRRPDDRWVTGVCSGVAARLGIDPVIVRVGMIVLTMLSGAGLVLYALGYLFLPTAAEPAPIVRLKRTVPEGVLLIGLGILAVIGIGSIFSGGDFGPGMGMPLAPLLILGGLGYYLHSHGKLGSWSSGGAGTTAPPPPPGATGSPLSAISPQDAVDPQPYAAPVLIPPTPVTEYAGPATAHPIPAVVNPIPTPAHPSHLPAPPDAASQGVAGTVRQRRPRHRRLGPVATLVALGGAAAAYGLVFVTRPGDADTNLVTIGLAAAVAVLGLVLLIAGTLGRRGGLVAFVAVLLALGAVASTAGAANYVSGGVGDRTWSASSVPAQGFRLGVGDATLVLPATPAAATAAPIPVHQGVGTLTIRIPKDHSVRLRGSIRLGSLSQDNRPIAETDPGRITFDRVIGTGPLVGTVHADFGVGSINVVSS